MASRLSDCLVRDGTLRADMVRAATARQAVYGGAHHVRAERAVPHEAVGEP